MKNCVITAASNMSDETYGILCDRITKKFGGEISFTRKTDDSIIGGFVIKLDNTVIDYSAATQLKELKKRFSE